MSDEKSFKKRKSIADMVRKGISVTGAVTRSIAGLGAAVLLLFAFKRKKSKKP